MRMKSVGAREALCTLYAIWIALFRFLIPSEIKFCGNFMKFIICFSCKFIWKLLFIEFVSFLAFSMRFQSNFIIFCSSYTLHIICVIFEWHWPNICSHRTHRTHTDNNLTAIRCVRDISNEPAPQPTVMMQYYKMIKTKNMPQLQLTAFEYAWSMKNEQYRWLFIILSDGERWTILIFVSVSSFYFGLFCFAFVELNEFVDFVFQCPAFIVNINYNAKSHSIDSIDLKPFQWNT